MRHCVERSLVCCECEESGGEFLFSFAASEPTFAGHFPQQPILPGVFQLEMTRLACERVTNRCLEIEKIKKAKFTRPILPEEEISLSVKVRSHNDTYHAKAAISVSDHQAGRIELVLRTT